MKVLMFGWEFPPHISGGLGTACYGLTKGLLQNDVEVIFVVPKTFGDEDTRYSRIIGASDVPVSNYSGYTDILTGKFTSFGINSLIVPYINTEEFQRYSEEKEYAIENRNDNFSAPRFQFTGKYGKDLLSEVWRYATVAGEIAIGNTYDIIHAHDWLSFPAGIVAKQLTRKPLVVHVHATEYDRSGDNMNPHVYEIERQGMESADKVIAVSSYTKQIIVDKYGIAADKVVVIHNGIEQGDIPEKPVLRKRVNEKIVTYLGRVTFQKGPEYFIEAAAKVLSRNKNYRFVMAGDGDMLYRMIRMAAQLRISSHFHFTGFLRGMEIPQMFSMTDLYVMPSVSEPFGISPLEAVRADVPVIISKQSGVKEVLANAITVDFWDTDAMANAIYALTQYQGLSKTLVRNSKQELKKLRWDIQAFKVKQLYQLLQ